jgi:carbon monoxide dehydrogenase subunit G
MKFEGTVSINAEASRVWECLLDVDCFAGCMPGMEQVNKIDDNTFDGVISASVGPINGRFTYRAQIVDAHPITQMSAVLNGTDSVTKSTVKGDVRVNLEPLAPEKTQLTYHAVVDIKGRLAILGDMVLRATATLMLEEFTRRLQRQIESASTA